MGVFSNVRLRVTYHTVVCVAMSSAPKLQGLKIGCYPKGYAAPSDVPCQCNMRRSPSKLKRTLPQSKIYVTSKSPVGDISVVTLIRTDTTLDHSQKAEKVWSVSAWEVRVKTMQNICGAVCSGNLMRLARICSDLLGCACICLAPLGYAWACFHLLGAA